MNFDILKFNNPANIYLKNTISIAMFELREFTSNPFTLIMEARVLFDAKAMFNKNR